jgi:hypothetical protein
MTSKTTFILALLFLFLRSDILEAQIRFSRVYGGNSYDTGAEVIQTPDDGYLIAGTTGSFGVESGQILLTKTDPEGYVEWRRFYGNVNSDQATSMQTSSDGNLIIAGNTETADSSYQMYALKMTFNGDTIWTRNYGGADWDFCRQVVALPDGGFALFGQTYTSGDADFSLIRINSDGEQLWTKTYGGSLEESGESIALATDGGFYLAGHTKSFGEGMNDMYVVRTDANGDAIWTETFGGPLEDVCYSVAETIDLGYVLAGGTENNTAGISDMVIRKENAADTWVTYESMGGDAYFTDALIEPGTGNIVVVGYHENGGFGKEDARILRYGNFGGIWNGVARSHGGQEIDRFVDVKRCSDNGYVMVGFTQGFLNRFDDIYLVKAGNDGIGAQPELGVDKIILEAGKFDVSVGPTPFGSVNPQLFIQDFQSVMKEISNPLSVEVYNSVGQVVSSSLVVSNKTILALGHLSNGVYYYQLETSNAVLATGKLVKLH